MRRTFQSLMFVLLSLALLRPVTAQVGISISVGFAPPPIPEYEQPPCPQEGYLWVPGYWGWDEDDYDYYWIPGTWVMAPEPGLLWTPAYWSWDDGAYAYHDGYWANEVGFYGGVNYGYGYFGDGFSGGRWDNDRFMYNSAVLNVNQTVIRNVYVDRTVIVNNNGPRVSYNGGNGGTNTRPTPRDEQVAHARQLPPAQPQLEHLQAARTNPQLRASANQGKPPVAATPKPGEFAGAHVVQAKAAGGAWNPPADRRAAAKPHSGGGENARPGEVAQPGENARPGNTRPGNENVRPSDQQSNQREQEQRQEQMQHRQQQVPPQARPDQSRPQQERPPQARPNEEKRQTRPEKEKPQRERPQHDKPGEERPDRPQ
jgi:hypothetical protein